MTDKLREQIAQEYYEMAHPGLQAGYGWEILDDSSLGFIAIKGQCLFFADSIIALFEAHYRKGSGEPPVLGDEPPILSDDAMAAWRELVSECRRDTPKSINAGSRKRRGAILKVDQWLWWGKLHGYRKMPGEL